MKHNFTNLYI